MDRLAWGWTAVLLQDEFLDSLLSPAWGPQTQKRVVSLLHISGVPPYAPGMVTLIGDCWVVVPSQQATTRDCLNFLSFCQQHHNMLSPTNKTLKDY